MYPRDLPRRKARELSLRPGRAGWAALATLWSRLFVEAAPALARWPVLRKRTEDGLAVALSLAAGLRTIGDLPHDLVTDLQGFAIDDDASPEWQHIIDLTGMLVDCLGGMPLDDLLEGALATFLDGQMHVLGDELGARNAAELQDLLAGDPRWRRTVSWVDSL